nr:histidinol-phosphatase [Oscillospiraceae bacterium]
MGYIDFHAHILPGADHGSSSIEESLCQLRFALDYGIDRIVATPHFYPHAHTVDSFLETRDNAYRALSESNDTGVDVRLGAEVLICQGLENLPELDKLFISGTNSLLLELPIPDFEKGYFDSVSEMTKQGIDVILAHADRYPISTVEKMLCAGARLQLNASSLLGLFKRREIYSMIEEKKVVALGSDIHGRDKKAYRDYAKAMKKIGHNAEYIIEQSNSIWNISKANK